MSLRNLIPWRRNNTGNGNHVPSVFDDNEPFLSLRREMNRLFDDAFRSFNGYMPAFDRLPSFDVAWPNIEIADNEKEIRVTAEIPGLEEKDIEVLLDDGMLTLKGEKRSDTEDESRQFSERFYGRFERRIPLGVEVQEDKVDARFKNGVLSIVLPKSEAAQAQVKRIAVRS